MQQPTPAPTEYHGSPPPSSRTQRGPTVHAEGHPIEYHEPPGTTDYGTPFYVLSALFDRLQNERRTERRKKLLTTWFTHWRDEKGPDLYPVLRLILPQKDRERSVYGLKEKNLAKIYIKLIPLGRNDPDAVRLLNWKRPTEKESAAGDFPTVLYEVVGKRSSVMQGTLTIGELNTILDDLSENLGKSDKQSKIMQQVYNRTTPEEQRWIARIILKDMIISVKETTVFSVFHPDAHDLWNTCSDLKKVAYDLYDPNQRLNEEDKSVQIFRAFAPMLCKRPSRKLEDTVKEMGGGSFIVEEKLDGERIQLHKRGNEYFYCSRKGKDYTYLYGKHVGTGSLTPFIDKGFDPRVDEIILDGEMLVWDPDSERYLPFGRLKTAASDKNKSNPRPCYKIFDLLYLNGQSLLHRSLKFRKRNLRACLSEVKGHVEFAEEYEASTAQEVNEHMERIMADKGEGLVLKHPDSEYVLNGRNKDWVKVKPEYMDNMGETVDALVVGGNYGTGRRSGGVSTLICAVLEDRETAVEDDNDNDDDDEPKYSTFVRIGTGFSFNEYEWIRSKPWKQWDQNSPPSFLLTAKKGQDDKGDVYLEPEDSFIVKVKAAEITESDQYHLGYTMRFPRALMIREDLSPVDCMTASALIENKRSEKKRKAGKDGGSSKKKRRTAKPTMLPQYTSSDLKDIKAETNLFQNERLMVVSDPKSKTGEQDKKKLQQMIKANGGRIALVANNKKEPLLVVYGGATIPYDVKLIMKNGTIDIVRPEWVKRCVAKGELVPLKKKYFYHATDARQATDEYALEDESDDEEPDATPAPDEDVDMPSATEREPIPEKPSKPESKPEPEPEPEETDPELAAWFKVDGKNILPKASQLDDDDGSETEPESDNEDTRSLDEDVEDIADEWVNVPAEKEPDVKMGEDDSAMEYDQDLIFKHLSFYLDSPSNARKNDMTVKTSQEAQIESDFEDLARTITANGGKVVALDELKLTHIILDKRDASRRLELMKRTAKPKHRYIVLSAFIEACLEEETLLDEDAFTP